MIEVDYIGTAISYNFKEAIICREKARYYGGEVMIEKQGENTLKYVKVVRIKFQDPLKRKQWEDDIESNFSQSRILYVGQLKISSYRYEDIIQEAKKMLPNHASLWTEARKNGFFVIARFEKKENRNDWEEKSLFIEHMLFQQVSISPKIGKVYFAVEEES